MIVERKTLLGELQWAQRFVERKTTIPILADVLFTAEGNTLTLTGTDLEVAGVTTLAGRTRGRFEVAAPVKQLIKYLGKLDTEEVELTTTPAHRLIVTAGPDKLVVHGLSRESYPELPTPPADGPVAVLGNFAQAVSRVGFAISLGENRFTLNGALLEAEDTNEARLVATDAHRLSLVPLTYRGPEKLRVLVPRIAMNEAARLDGNITLQHADAHLFFTSGHRRIVARKLTGNFPDWRRVMGRTDWPNHVFLPARETLKALERVALYADERSRAVRFSVTPEALRIFAEAIENGAAEANIPVAGGQVAAPVEAGFNADYVGDFLRVNGDGAVAFCWADEKSLALLASDDQWMYGVMPMRI